MSVKQICTQNTGYLLPLLGLVLLVISCTKNIEPEEDIIVATAFDKNLYLSEVESLFGPNMSRQDSIMIEKGYIDGWLKKQVLLYYSEKDGVGSSDEINKKVEEFRQDLITYEYRKKLLSQKLDTNISLNESKAYYESHPENFELKQNIVRCVFIKMPLELENKNNYWKSFKNSETESLAPIAIAAIKGGGNAFMEKEQWQAFDDILKVVPITTYNQESFINNNRIFKIEEKDFVWFINILEFRIKDHISPFEFVEENIHQILLNKRKVEILEKLEDEMIVKANNDKKISVFPIKR